jgi:hypothetical protein
VNRKILSDALLKLQQVGMINCDFRCINDLRLRLQMLFDGNIFLPQAPRCPYKCNIAAVCLAEHTYICTHMTLPTRLHTATRRAALEHSNSFATPGVQIRVATATLLMNGPTW